MLEFTDRLKRIVTGNVADLVLFDPHTVIDSATYEQPTQLSQGVVATVVNGVVVYRGGMGATGARPGRMLRRQEMERPMAGWKPAQGATLATL